MSEEIQARLEERIAAILAEEAGKPREYLLVNFQDKQNLFFAGRRDLQFVLVEINSAGTLTADQKQAVVSRISALYEEVLSIPADRVFVVIREIPRNSWGFRGNLLGS